MGDLVKILPYYRESFPRDILYLLWLMIEEAGDWKNIFWNDAENWPYHPAWLGDLPYWIGYVHDSKDPKMFYFVVDKAEDKLCGVIWFSAINQEAGTCDSNIWMQPKYRGARTIEAMEKCAAIAFNMGIKCIFGITRNAKSRNNAVKRCGWEQEAYFPKLQLWKLRLDKNTWLKKQTSSE